MLEATYSGLAHSHQDIPSELGLSLWSHVSPHVSPRHLAFSTVQTDAMLSLRMCVTEFDFVLGKCSLESSSDVLRYNCPHVSKYGMRCLQYIPLARL